VSTKKCILLLALAMAVLGMTAFALMAVKDRTYVASEAYAPVGEPNRAVAVVYYSRSGHPRPSPGRLRARSMRRSLASRQTILWTSRVRERPSLMRTRASCRGSRSDPSISTRFAVSSWCRRPGCSARRRRFGLTSSRPTLRARKSCLSRPATAGSSKRRSMRSQGGSRHEVGASLSTFSYAGVASTGRRAARICWLRLAREYATSGDQAAPL
jgi:hypothetical protein